MLNPRKYIRLYYTLFDFISFDLSFIFEPKIVVLSFLKRLSASLTFHASTHILPFSCILTNPHMKFDKIYMSIVTIWSGLLHTNLKLHLQYSTHI